MLHDPIFDASEREKGLARTWLDCFIVGASSDVKEKIREDKREALQPL